MQTTHPTPEQVSQALREVYGRPEFRVRNEPSLWDLLRRPLRRLWDWLAGLLDGLSGLSDSTPWLFWAIMAALALAALGILIHLIMAALSAFEGREPRRSPGAAAEPAAPRGAADWEAEARRAAAEGRMRDAALALYQALLVRLDARGAVRLDPAKTPGDYRREVRRTPELSTPFALFLRGFEPVAFGGRALDAEGYQRLLRAAEAAGARG